MGRCVCGWARCFFASFNGFNLSAPLVEASLGDPKFLGQLPDALAGLHALDSYALELPGISLSFLHSRFLSRKVCPSRVCQFKGSFQTRKIEMDIAGPKLRTGSIQPGPTVLKYRPERDAFGRVTSPARIWLTPAN
jgi:hypothetical protein